MSGILPPEGATFEEWLTSRLLRDTVVVDDRAELKRVEILLP